MARKKSGKNINIKQESLNTILRDYVYEYYDVDLDSKDERLTKEQKAEFANIAYNSLKSIVDMK